jgi:hypothetical protein
MRWSAAGSVSAAATGAPSPPDRFVAHMISERTIEHVGIALTGNPRLVPELYPHMVEPVCQRCGAPADCDHVGHEPGPLVA